MPHSDQQVSKIYYLSPCKVHLFGIQDEAVREQINYVLNEDEIIGKGPNGTLSMIFDGIKKLNKGEKHLIDDPIHEVEMKQFQLFWMVEMVEINFNFLIKF